MKAVAFLQDESSRAGANTPTVALGCETTGNQKKKKKAKAN